MITTLDGEEIPVEELGNVDVSSSYMGTWVEMQQIQEFQKVLANRGVRAGAAKAIDMAKELSMEERIANLQERIDG